MISGVNFKSPNWLCVNADPLHSLEILRDWFNLIDDDGWVGREQILGAEARSRVRVPRQFVYALNDTTPQVPPEFVAQYPTYANPPTLAMAVTALIKRLREAAGGEPSIADLGMDTGMQIPIQDRTPGNRYLESPSLAQEFLVTFYPKLKKHYEWFRKTQRGQIKQYGRKARSRTEAYRWRGRSEKHVLTSGLDDYPRANASAGELHLDLISWMGFFTRTMRDIAGFMGNEDDEAMFAETEQAIIDNIDGMLPLFTPRHSAY
jgi:mannosyl-oligosaccharide glucosidase